MTENLKPRIYKFDNVKLLAIVLVVIGQFAEGFTDNSDMFRSWFVFVYSFHAPLFIFLSGLFTKQYEKGQKFNIQKFTFLIAVGYLLKLLIYGGKMLNGENPALDLFGGYTVEWFVFVLAMHNLTAYILKGLNRNAVLIGSLALALAAGFFPISDEGYLSRYFVFMPFFFAGYYLTPMTVRKFSHRTNVKFASIAFMFIYFVMCFRQREIIYPFRMLFTGRNPYATVPIEGCTFYHRLLCYGISAVLIIAVISCIPNRKIPILTRMGRNTLGAYFWHYPVILILKYFGFFVILKTLGDPMWKLAVLASAIVLALLLSADVFALPLKKLESLIKKMPFRWCLFTDAAIFAAALAATIILRIL